MTQPSAVGAKKTTGSIYLKGIDTQLK